MSGRFVAQERLNAIGNQISSSKEETTTRSAALKKIFTQKSDDIVITCAVRTPLTKARKGLLKDTPAEDLLISILQSLLAKSDIDPHVVEDVCVGNVLSPGFGYGARSAVLAAGFPVSTAANVVNRFCSSGLLSIQNIASSISSGAINVGIATGVESMSTNPDKPPILSQKVMAHPIAKDNVMPMGWTSENIAKDFAVTREMQDEYAQLSHSRAERARAEGWSDDEIAPVIIKTQDPMTGAFVDVIVKRDDGIRAETTRESLRKIRPAFPQWQPSTTTGGNASQITDGAAAILMMKRSTAEMLGQKVIGKFVMSTVVGLEPRIMGVGPSLAIPKLLARIGLNISEIDLFEINEAFASMSVHCIQELGLDIEKVNCRGGAIALGHPLGCTGVRQVVTALSELKRRKEKIAVTSMCVGTGMGMAGLFIKEY